MFCPRVEHHRTGLALPVGEVEVLLTREVCNHAHAREVRERLYGLGYRNITTAAARGPRSVADTP